MSISVFLLWLVSIPLAIHAIPEPKGFFLNCGGNAKIGQDSIEHMTDEDFIKVGNKSAVTQPGILPMLSTLRYFPSSSSKKYCYTFPVLKGQKFLVKTIYYYGGYDGGKDPPVFDQIIDGTKWSTVNTTEDYAQGLSSYYEVIVMAQSKSLSVCLARNTYTSSYPFISGLEVQYLEDSLYNSTNFEKYALVTLARNTFGSAGDIIRFPEDKFNRYWQPFKDENPVVSSQSNVTSETFWNIPPNEAFATAMTTSRGKTLKVKWPPLSLPSSLYYIALYFQDNRNPSPYSWRVFDVDINGKKFYSNVNISTSGVTIYGTEWPLSGQSEISLTPKSDSPVGPIINAGEIFQIMALGGRTLTRDVNVMKDLVKGIANTPEDWNGDPCLPKENAWTGVTCSIGKTTRVISLNLTGLQLQGSLPQSLSKLTAVKHIWLGENKLSGTIPDLKELMALETLHLEGNQFEDAIPKSLGDLPNLREVFLQNNKLTGSIPESLKKNKKINLQVSPGNNLTT